MVINKITTTEGEHTKIDLVYKETMLKTVEEMIIRVDEKDNALGPIEKMEAHHKGILHRAFSILVFNSSKQLLLQRRSLSKYHTPGLWTNTCCSHPRFGERTAHAVSRRLQEEMGFQCALSEVFEFVYKTTFETDLHEYEFDHVFIGFYDGEVNINLEEVSEYKWLDLDAIKLDIEKSPDQYTYWFKYLFALAEDKIRASINELPI
ncbi:isopentenyl-diphosphate Delta-isomerase [Fusibacter sp. 3D3]|uniref:isopentenyl-diphosphate Delta-isomerase n=1 Tax=Fusibacter sp. 3D3 TaxID=1048380 RepID=UPI0008584E85|nr:isopentenyl-diphosphate Delta-isomerase [Fusibacter sp. 3D3]GAU76018.1 isopentenyl-diphosphate delta-isomerase [Fusibacter sp. 3D3]